MPKVINKAVLGALWTGLGISGVCLVLLIVAGTYVTVGEMLGACYG